MRPAPRRRACSVRPHDARDAGRAGASVHARAGLGRELEHRAVEPGLADRELRRVDADREPAGAGVEVVARQRALPPLVEAASRVERQRVGGDDGPGPERRQGVCGDVSPVHQPSSGPAIAWTSRGVPAIASRRSASRTNGRSGAKPRPRVDGRRPSPAPARRRRRSRPGHRALRPAVSPPLSRRGRRGGRVGWPCGRCARAGSHLRPSRARRRAPAALRGRRARRRDRRRRPSGRGRGRARRRPASARRSRLRCSCRASASRSRRGGSPDGRRPLRPRGSHRVRGGARRPPARTLLVQQGGWRDLGGDTVRVQAPCSPTRTREDREGRVPSLPAAPRRARRSRDRRGA